MESLYSNKLSLVLEEDLLIQAVALQLDLLLLSLSHAQVAKTRKNNSNLHLYSKRQRIKKWEQLLKFLFTVKSI